jgi:hypothetical protein
MLWASSEVKVIPERHHFFFAGLLLAGLLWFRSVRGQRCEQKKKDQRPENCARFYRSHAFLLLPL